MGATAERGKAKIDPESVAERSELAEIIALFARINLLIRRFEKRHAKHLKGDEMIPDYGLVKVIEPPEEFEEITGKDGVVLGSSHLENKSYTYTVLILPDEETYYLRGSALQFTGKVSSHDQVYS